MSSHSIDLNRTRVQGCFCDWAICRCPVDFIVYASDDIGQFIIERVSDKQEMDKGSLEEIMKIINECSQYRNKKTRRATWGEDTLRRRPGIFTMAYKGYPGEFI